MHISLEITKENEDGSADAVVDYDEDGLKVIVQYGVIAMLKEGMEHMKKKVNVESMYRLEDAIEKFSTIVDDLELLYKTHGDRREPMDENEMANALLGLITKGKMVHYWARDTYLRCFELNDYAPQEVKDRRAEILRDFLDDDEEAPF